MRIDRALQKLRTRLISRGIKSTSAALTMVLTQGAAPAAPVGLASMVTTAALAKSTASGGLMASLWTMKNLQIGIAGLIAVAGATAFVSQARTNTKLSGELAALDRQNSTMAGLRRDNQALAKAAAEADETRRDGAELARLRSEAASLQSL